MDRVGDKNHVEKMDHVGTAAFARPSRAKLGRPSTLEAPVLFEGKKQKTKIYSRDDLRPGQHYSGPAIITEYSATTSIPPGKRFHLDLAANLLIAVRKRRQLPGRAFSPSILLRNPYKS